MTLAAFGLTAVTTGGDPVGRAAMRADELGHGSISQHWTIEHIGSDHRIAEGLAKAASSSYSQGMGVFSKLNERRRQARLARAARKQALEAEARRLLAEKGRLGALRALDVQRDAAIGHRAELHKIADLVTTIFRLTPPALRIDTAARILRRDWGGDDAHSASAVATRVRESLTSDPLTETLSRAVGALRVEGPDETGNVVVFLAAANGAVIAHQVGVAGQHPSADAWLAWRDDLA
jgi:hypothetical protein